QIETLISIAIDCELLIVGQQVEGVSNAVGFQSNSLAPGHQLLDGAFVKQAAAIDYRYPIANLLDLVKQVARQDNSEPQLITQSRDQLSDFRESLRLEPGVLRRPL